VRHPDEILTSRYFPHLPAELPHRLHGEVETDRDVTVVDRFYGEQVFYRRLHQGCDKPRPRFGCRRHLGVGFRQRMDGIQIAARGQNIQVKILARFEILQRVGDLAANGRVAHNTVAEQIDQHHGGVRGRAGAVGILAGTGLGCQRLASRETKKDDVPGLPILLKLEIRAAQSGHRLALRVERYDI